MILHHCDVPTVRSFLFIVLTFLLYIRIYISSYRTYVRAFVPYIRTFSSRFHAVSASENLIRGQTGQTGHNDNRRVSVKKNQRKNSTGGLPSENFARGLVSSILSPGSKKSRKASFGGAGLKNSEEEEDVLPLEIRSEKEASACLLQLKKTSDQLLLAALRKTLDEVSDVVTYGKTSVQEWMNISPDMSTTPFMSRQQSSMGAN